METDPHNISAKDKFEESLTSPYFNEETTAAARPVVPLGSTNVAQGTNPRMRNTWPWALFLTLAITAIVGIAVAITYRNTGTGGVPSAATPTVSETIIESVPEPSSLAPSNQPAKPIEPDVQATTARKRREPQSVVVVSDQPVRRDWKEAESRDDDEGKSAEHARKEEKKRLKRQRKEAEKLAEHARDSEDNDKPKARLVGVYTVKRKH